VSSSEPAPSSDDFDLHFGLDRELDLASERPSAATHQPSRGPGLLVAAIVVSSLTLAGAVTLVRGDRAQAPAVDEGIVPPTEVASSVAPLVEAPVSPEPPAAARQGPRALPTPASPTPTRHRLVPPPPRIEPTPAAIAVSKPVVRPRLEASAPVEAPPHRDRFALPAPRFDDEASATHDDDRPRTFEPELPSSNHTPAHLGSTSPTPTPPDGPPMGSERAEEASDVEPAPTPPQETSLAPAPSPASPPADAPTPNPEPLALP